MNTKITFKLVVLLTALSFTIIAIIWLKQGHMNAFWTSLGVDKSGTRLNWCLERTASLYLYENKAKLLEKDGKWYWAASHEAELDYLRVEKWFAKYCQIPITNLTAEPTGQAKPLFEAQFIDGQRLTLYQWPSGAFKIQDKVFESENLRQAIQELLAFGEKIE